MWKSPRVAADEPVPRVIVAVMMGMRPLAVFYRLLLLGS
jgi:hypothetical protein